MERIYTPTRVEAFIEPYNRTQDRYQAYYRRGLAAYCASQGIAFDETGFRFPSQLRFLARVRASDKFRKILPDPVGVGRAHV